MNKKLYYHFGKNDFSTITSRGIGSSSGIIKLSNQYSTEKNIYSGIKRENSKNKNISSISSNSGKDLNTDTIKEYNNYLSNNNNNNFISTLPYTKENLPNNNQNMLFGNKYINADKDINFDFYKNNQLNEQNYNKKNNISINQNKKENEIIKQPMKKIEVENLLNNKNNVKNNINKISSKKSDNKCQNNPVLTTNRIINSKQFQQKKTIFSKSLYLQIE